MNALKSVTPALAFILAIVTAWGAQTFANNPRGKRISDGACVTGKLLAPPTGKQCSSTNTFIRCQVIIQDSGEPITVAAFEDHGSCREELFFDN